MFKSIFTQFLKLLLPENNSYKYVQYYREQMNKFIEDIKEDNGIDAYILKQLLFILMIIYEERTKCRYHTNDKIAATIEKEIIPDAIIILKEDKYIEQKIVEINEIVTSEIDEDYFAVFKSTCGFDMIVNHEAITEITDENVRDIYTNFHNIRKLLELTDSFNEKHKEIDDYLFCLYYFGVKHEHE